MLLKLQSDGSVTSSFCNTHEKPEIPKQPESLVKRMRLFYHKNRYTDWRPSPLHKIKWASSLVAVPSDLPLPPAI